MSLQVWLPLNGNNNNVGLSSRTFSGSPNSWTNGKIGKCATFNNNASQVIYSNCTDFNYKDNFSYAVWFKQKWSSKTAAAMYIFTCGRVDTGTYGYGLQINGDTIQCRFGSATYSLTSISCTEDVWYHVAFVKSGTSIKVYLNGTLMINTTFSGTLPTYSTSEARGLGLGAFWYSSSIYPFIGSLNDFRLYDHPLSDKEVKMISKGLCVHYTMNSIYNAINKTHLGDCAGLGNTSVIKVNSPVVSTNTPRYTNSIDFASTGYFKSDSLGLVTTEFSLSFWVYARDTTSKYQHFLLGTFDDWTGNGIGIYRDTGKNFWNIVMRSTTESSHCSFGGQTVNYNTWYQFVITYDGANVKVYRNNSLITTKAYTGTVNHPVLYLGNSKFYGAPVSETEDCIMSDFRMYATALTAADVNEICCTRASIDDKGNLIAHELKEN